MKTLSILSMERILDHRLVEHQVVVRVIGVGVAVLLAHAPVGVVSNQSEPVLLLQRLERCQQGVK